MMRSAVATFQKVFPNLPSRISRAWFEFISLFDSGSSMLFMNYGYSPLADEPTGPVLDQSDETNRYPLQLYHQVASAVPLTGLSVVEVGCGRGGGAHYVHKYLQPASTLGIDITHNAIKFCKSYYDLAGLDFAQGDAQDLKGLADASVDVILNVESSICYPDVPRFFNEVVRVLRPGGYFLYADLRTDHELDMWEDQLSATGLIEIERQNITPNVIHALDLDDARRQQMINRYSPRLVRPIVREFAGVKGSQFFYGALQSGEKVYKRFVFQKPTV